MFILSEITDPYNICYYRDYDTMNPANHNQREHSSLEDILKSTRITTTLLSFPPSSKQIISISIIASLFSLSIMMIIFDFNTMSKNIAFAQNTTSQSSSSSSSSNTNATGAAALLNCTSLPAKISKNAVALQNPNKDVCDIVILRQSPQIIGHNGTILNKFLAINSLVEMMNAPSNMSKSSVNSSQPVVVVMGEFALLQSELKPILMAMSQYNWNITAVHNHPILEKPPMIFVHWDALGNLNTIAAQIKEVMTLDQNLSLQQSQATSNKTSSDNPISAIGKQIGSAIGLGSNGGK
jgi:hypothetical protein